LPIIKSGAGAFDFLEDVGGLWGPDERLGFLSVSVDVVVDGGDEFFNAAEDAAGAGDSRAVSETIAYISRVGMCPQGMRIDEDRPI
jgi:hypothetical protein